jgi:polysaccharide biosynthesis protein PslH
LVIGRNPPASLRALAEKDPGIRITGTVPDVRPLMAEAAAMVLPLRVGGGTRIKIYEAMAMGAPVISTTIGAEGLDVTHGKNILLADTAEAFAAETAGLLGEPGRAQAMASEARRHVAEKYSWGSVAEIFAGFCDRVARERGNREATEKGRNAR